MSVDLDVGALAGAADSASACADAYEAGARAASSASLVLGLSWEGSSYSAFSSSVEGSAVPMALASAEACRSLAQSMESARELAASLRARSEGFQGVLIGEGAGDYPGDARAGRLYSDDACFDPIDADLAGAESEVSAAQSAFWEAEGLLWGLSTRSVRMDGGGFASGLAGISSGLSAFRGSFSAYRSGMADLEAAASSASSAAEGVFSPKPVSAIVSGGRVLDPAALAWLLSRPPSLLSPEERAAADELRAAGWSFPARYTAAGEPSSDPSTAEDLLSAAGYIVWAHESSFDLAKGITRLVDSEAYGWIKGLGKHLGPVGYVLCGVSASFDSIRYYDAHPELPEDRRLSNQAAEWDLKFVQGCVGVIPPLEDIAERFFYTKNEETGLSLADHFYEWRYETFGRHGL
ncbi:hypothetical protein B5F40_15605 [Gordonibacter sp. An230]|uniref:hypothetical protein n=1 Tax=Gordonibacter sp. An230 TaxID=1965592 RepID=UPI000B38E644|nr:hypothetical protein [Gordonibacter sp. An230]OUO85825.1 hypothetical protein B5F40_15605 [Gordonibacter sp. An230]